MFDLCESVIYTDDPQIGHTLRVLIKHGKDDKDVLYQTPFKHIVTYNMELIAPVQTSLPESIGAIASDIQSGAERR